MMKDDKKKIETVDLLKNTEALDMLDEKINLFQVTHEIMLLPDGIAVKTNSACTEIGDKLMSAGAFMSAFSDLVSDHSKVLGTFVDNQMDDALDNLDTTEEAVITPELAKEFVESLSSMLANPEKDDTANEPKH